MSRHIPYKKKKEHITTLIEKGSTDAIKIDKDEIERTISFLRDNYDVKLINAPKNLSNDVDKLRKVAKQLQGLDTYIDFYKLIINHFGDIDNIEPGTIGAFCYGCNYRIAETNTSTLTEYNRACFPTCIGSIPTPNMPHWINCDSNVYILYRDKEDMYKWKEINHLKNPKTNYIFFIDELPDIPINYDIIKEKNIYKFSLYNYNGGIYKHIMTNNNASLRLSAIRRNKSPIYYFNAIILFFLLLVIISIVVVKKYKNAR